MWGFAEDNDRAFGALDDFRRRMDRLFEGFDARWGGNDAYGAGYPRAELRDTGGELVLEADVPGLTDKDIQLTVTQDTLGLSGERQSSLTIGLNDGGTAPGTGVDSGAAEFAFDETFLVVVFCS